MSTKARLQNLLTRAGKWVLILGSGPLIIFTLLDILGFPVSDNPIGLGLLFFFSTPIGVLLLMAGLIAGGSKEVSSQTASHYRIDPELAAKVAKIQGAKLTAEEMQYIDSRSVGACLGVLYFIFLGTTGAFFRHLPGNFVYTNVIQCGRRQAWEAKSWRSFDEFKQLNDRVDRSAFIMLAISIPVVLLLVIK